MTTVDSQRAGEVRTARRVDRTALPSMSRLADHFSYPAAFRMPQRAERFTFA